MDKDTSEGGGIRRRYPKEVSEGGIRRRYPTKIVWDLKNDYTIFKSMGFKKMIIQYLKVWDLKNDYTIFKSMGFILVKI
jgi:hypothetical protein